MDRQPVGGRGLLGADRRSWLARVRPLGFFALGRTGDLRGDDSTRPGDTIHRVSGRQVRPPPGYGDNVRA